MTSSRTGSLSDSSLNRRSISSDEFRSPFSLPTEQATLNSEGSPHKHELIKLIQTEGTKVRQGTIIIVWHV